MLRLQLKGKVRKIKPCCLTYYIFGLVDKPHPDRAWNLSSVGFSFVLDDKIISLHPKQRLNPVTGRGPIIELHHETSPPSGPHFEDYMYPGTAWKIEDINTNGVVFSATNRNRQTNTFTFRLNE